MIKGNIVLVPFPFDDFSNTKVRPAVCLTGEIGIYNHVIIAFISSKIPNEILPSDIIIKVDAISNSGTGLIIDSVIRLHKLVTIPKTLIKRKLGVLNNDVNNEVQERLKDLFGI